MQTIINLLLIAGSLLLRSAKALSNLLSLAGQGLFALSQRMESAAPRLSTWLQRCPAAFAEAWGYGSELIADLTSGMALLAEKGRLIQQQWRSTGEQLKDDPVWGSAAYSVSALIVLRDQLRLLWHQVSVWSATATGTVQPDTLSSTEAEQSSPTKTGTLHESSI